jgi:hypothetical protein
MDTRASNQAEDQLMKKIMISERNLKQFAVMVVTCFALISTQYVFANDTALTTDEVIELISGKTVHGTSSKGKKYKMYFKEDNTVISGRGSYGDWEVKDGSVCNTWDGRGFAGCDKVYRKDNGEIFYTVPSGKKGKFRKFEEGNQL